MTHPTLTDANSLSYDTVSFDRHYSQQYYQALVDKDSRYEGVFIVGVQTTGIFCRPTCPARKPKFENCEFFPGAEAALLAGYRPCKRCQPLLPVRERHPLLKRLLEAVDANPTKRWREADLAEFAADASTIRRQFKKHVGMTFVQYARARRLGLAMKAIRAGDSVIDGQLTAGYDSSSGFREAITQVLGTAPSRLADKQNILTATWLDTPLGAMLAVTDEQGLYLLEFVDRRALETELARLRERYTILPGDTQISQQLRAELDAYFAGTSAYFQTPLQLLGTPFQTSVWRHLRTIPAGQTCSYKHLAEALGKPTAVRAVAAANGANQLAILVPCHRVIGSDGNLRGYGGGLARKRWLLEHEVAHFS